MIRGVSGDGRVVFGMLGGATSGTPFRWTRESGYQFFPNDSGYAGKNIYSCSEDGSVVVGHGGHSFFGLSAFRWNADNSVTVLEHDGLVMRTGYKVSGDGQTVAGEIAGTPVKAAFWNSTAGIVVPEGLPSPEFPSYLLAASHDGTIFGGLSSDGGGLAFLYSQAEGPVFVGDLGGRLGGASISDISATGEVLVGDSSAPEGRIAYLWREDFGIQRIPVILSDHRPKAAAVSADGRVVVGMSSVNGFVSRGVLYYTEGLGSVYLESLLNEQFGFSLPPAALFEAVDVSNDGRTIVGGGGDLGYWIVKLPEPTLVDFNRDEFADFHDLISFLDCFEGNSVLPSSSADLNRDGFTDFFDLIEFIDNF